MMISIITPVFNGKRFIMEAAKSVQEQCFKEWEWIIVNDGSTDGTATLLESLDDPRIKVIHQHNTGVSGARNAGLEIASGDYITFLDADDRLPPNALRDRAEFLNSHPEVDIVNGYVYVTSDEKFVRKYIPDMRIGPLTERLFRLEEGVFFGVNYMLRREKIGGHRFLNNVSHCEDLIFFLMLSHNKGLVYGAVDSIVYEYRVHKKSAMSNLDGIESGYIELIKKSEKLPGININCRTVQKKRVERILFRSWLRRCRPDKALLSLIKLRIL